MMYTLVPYGAGAHSSRGQAIAGPDCHNLSPGCSTCSTRTDAQCISSASEV